jgi:hypothetical protein
MTTVVINDIAQIEALSDEAAGRIVGGRVNLRGDDGIQPRPDPYGGGAGYTGIMIHYTLKVIE